MSFRAFRRWIGSAAVTIALGAVGCGGDEPSQSPPADDSPPKTEQPAPSLLPEGGTAPEQVTTRLGPAARAAGCELSAAPAAAPEHTSNPDERVSYPTNPPTSGRHFDAPAPDGPYLEAPPDEQLVHSLEHGRVVLWFDPSLPPDARAGLRALFEEDSLQLLLVPRKRMPYAVAASAWNGEPAPNGTGRLLLCEQFGERTYDALRTFGDEHRGRGPEPVP